MSAAEPLPCEDRYPFEPRETTTRDGAMALKSDIESYWRARGYEVQVMLIEGPFSPALRSGRIDVRSDLVDGLPRPTSKTVATGPVEVSWEHDQ